MPSAIGPDQNHIPTQPNRKTKPTQSEKAARKAATSAKLQAKEAQTASIIAGNLRTFGAKYKSKINLTESRDRNWTSLTPDENFMDAFVSGRYGKSGAPPTGSFDQDEFEEARAVAQAWQWQQLPVPNIVKSPGARQAASAEPLPCLPEKMDAKAINAAYERYALDSVDEAENLKTALFTFAPEDTRVQQCEKFLRKNFAYDRKLKFSHETKASSDYEPNFGDPEEILNEFAMKLWGLIQKGEYDSHEGKFERWITKKWTYFFADYQTKFYSELNLTDALIQADRDAEQPEKKGAHYRSDVEAQQVARDNRTSATAATRLEKFYADLDNPDSEWSKLRPDVKEMLYAMRSGTKKGQAAVNAGFSPDHGAKLLKAEIERVMRVQVAL